MALETTRRGRTLPATTRLMVWGQLTCPHRIVNASASPSTKTCVNILHRVRVQEEEQRGAEFLRDRSLRVMLWNRRTETWITGVIQWRVHISVLINNKNSSLPWRMLTSTWLHIYLKLRNYLGEFGSIRNSIITRTWRNMVTEAWHRPQEAPWKGFRSCLGL